MRRKAGGIQDKLRELRRNLWPRERGGDLPLAVGEPTEVFRVARQSYQCVGERDAIARREAVEAVVKLVKDGEIGAQDRGLRCKRQPHGGA